MDSIKRAQVLESIGRTLGWSDHELLEACKVMISADKMAQEKTPQAIRKNTDTSNMN